MKVTILGTGSSAGVPEVGCSCPVCTGGNPKNHRSRVSVLVEVGGKRILIDASPDLRQQALKNGISSLDAVIFTHDHADHTGGLDDLRAFNVRSDAPLDVYASAETLEILQSRYGYAFLPRPERAWYRPCLVPHTLPSAPVFQVEVAGEMISGFEQAHGKIKTYGYRFGAFAYSTDVDVMPDSAFEALEGVDTWMVDCLRYTASYTHSNLERTLGWIERLKPRMAILTHMAHDFDYPVLLGQCPAGVVPGYDGMVLEFE